MELDIKGEGVSSFQCRSPMSLSHVALQCRSQFLILLLVYSSFACYVSRSRIQNRQPKLYCLPHLIVSRLSRQPGWSKTLHGRRIDRETRLSRRRIISWKMPLLGHPMCGMCLLGTCVHGLQSAFFVRTLP